MKESSNPSFTSTDCYWRKSTLSTAVLGELRATSLSPSGVGVTKSPINYREAYLSKGMSGILSAYEDTESWGQPLSMHKLANKFWSQNRGISVNCSNFIEFVRTQIQASE
ncbi:hypothetical protein GE061_000191 [Apolygus lucorum]|uniref:Uncharacterized protein n=1 Tax=Apolygus lucorum TaxID=248454 RepID=A0A6A4K8I9_APOLU|nr:hypothetical protein GE061_000191 [Apolygus lucorum]